MIQDHTIQMLQKHFGELQQIKDDIIRCQKLFHDKPYQVLYIDFTDKWLGLNDDTKELEQYIETVIQNDYYKNAGYLQWNYYYTFISDDKKIIGKSDKKGMIERDKLYARKYIMTLSQLEEWLIKTENIGKKSSVEIKKDLGVEWIKKLKQAKLDAVFLNVSYKNGVESYIKGVPIIETEETSNGKEKSEVDIILNIINLKLINYRPYPSINEFDFGKVNLIKGANGSGKTSLFEAIELLLCGKTNRNFARDESENDLQANINNGKKKINFTPGNNILFKERDKLWYNTITPANVRSGIYERFNRFNFFNSDAAYQLSYGGQEEIRKAFEDIAIGDQVNWLEDRLIKFNDRFNRELSYYSKIIDDSEKELRENTKLLDEIGKIDNQPENLFKELTTEAKLINWVIDEGGEDIVTLFEKDITSAKYYIGCIYSDTDWIDNINQDKAEEELNRLKKTQENVTKIEQEINIIKRKLEAETKEHTELENVIQLILSAERYFKEEKISQIDGLVEKVDNVSKELSKLVKTKEAFSAIDHELYSKSNENLTQYETRLMAEIDDLELELMKVVKEIKDTENNLNQLDKIVTEIKAKGKEFLQLKQDATECPLCHTKHPKGRLIQLIEEVKEEFQYSEAHKHMLDKRTKLTNRLSILKKDEANFIKIKEVLYLYYGDADIKDKTIVEALKDIQYTIKSINQINEQLTKLKNLQLYFDEKGLNARDFVKLKDQLSSKNVQIDENYDKLKTEYEVKLNNIKRNIKIDQLAIEDLKNSLNNILEEVGIPVESAKLLNERIRKVGSAKENYKELNKIIYIDSKTLLTTTERSVNKILELFERYKELKKEKEEKELRIKASNQKIQELKKKIESNTTYRDNAQKACDAIINILENHSKTDFLKDFIELNKNEIVDIFKAIHAPKEFENMLFKEGKLYLKQIQSNKYAELTEISAGQRTALALSIFLALNIKLKKGPYILLFDEPVTNIDDLNVLSFIDYLRELVTKSDRQVFFATANENLAYLFKKKFGFLDDNELKEFILER